MCSIGKHLPMTSFSSGVGTCCGNSQLHFKVSSSLLESLQSEIGSCPVNSLTFTALQSRICIDVQVILLLKVN